MDKIRIRKDILNKRSETTSKQLDDLSSQISQNLWKCPEVKEADTILAFWPIIDRREIDLRNFIVKAHNAGKHILLPADLKFRTGAMSLRQFTAESTLLSGPFNTREPIGPNLPYAIVDLVLVPGLAFDDNGYRIGYGGGFYDRFLGKCSNVRSIGVCADQHLVDRLPVEAHDRPVNLILSELRRIAPPQTVTAR